MRKPSILLLIPLLGLAACGSGGNHRSAEQKSYDQIAKTAHGRTPFVPSNDVEFKNYNAAQKLYDSPSTIIWCSTTWGNPSAPIITVPVTGKLTSSTTSFFSPEHIDDSGADSGRLLVPSRSIDGLYHPTPPQYRYGFTPGGQYVDFFQMPTFCTTALTKFQRQQTKVDVTVDAQARALQRQAEAALRNGNHQQAQAILEGGLGG